MRSVITREKLHRWGQDSRQAESGYVVPRAGERRCKREPYDAVDRRLHRV